MRPILIVAHALAFAAIVFCPLRAQDTPATADPDALAKALSNPVASLISVPLQLNYDASHGPEGDGDRWTLNVQPVVPIALSPQWNLISRTIAPLIAQSDVLAGGGSQSGVGDVLQS